MNQNITNRLQVVLKNRNFRLLWIGQVTSMIGDQFSFIATPWLVLKISNDPLILGTVLALAGVPRAVFMLLGGAITDRFSSRLVMILSDALRLALTAVMAVLVLSGKMQIWMLYIFALLFGVVGGFFIPASGSMVPRLFDADTLQAGNSVAQGTQQFTLFLGPVLAGGVIALFSHPQVGALPDLHGIGLAFLVDAATFLVSILTLWLMDRQPSNQVAISAQDLLLSISEGIRFAFRDPALRPLLILVSIMNLLFIGPILVGIPVLANTRLKEGAVAFGLIVSAFGGGNLTGIVLAGILPTLKTTRIQLLLTTLTTGFSIVFFVFAFLTSTPLAFALMFLLGMGNGYLSILLVSMLQHRTPQTLLGRVMSILSFASLGLAPISQAIAGLVLRINLNTLFIGAGLVMILVTLWMIGRPEIRRMIQLIEKI